MGGEVTAPAAGGQGLGSAELVLEEIWRCQRPIHLGAARGGNMIQ